MGRRASRQPTLPRRSPAAGPRRQRCKGRAARSLGECSRSLPRFPRLPRSTEQLSGSSIVAIDAPVTNAECPPPPRPGSSRRARERRPTKTATASSSRTTPTTSSITCLTVPWGCGTRPSSSLPGPIVSTTPPTKLTLNTPTVNCVTPRRGSPRCDVQRRPDRTGVQRVRQAHRDRHANPSQHRLPTPPTPQSKAAYSSPAQPQPKAAVCPAPAHPWYLPAVRPSPMTPVRTAQRSRRQWNATAGATAPCARVGCAAGGGPLYCDGGWE